MITDEELQELEDWGTSPNPSTTRLVVKEIRALRVQVAALQVAMTQIIPLDTKPYIQIGEDPNFPGETIYIPGQIAKIAIAALEMSGGVKASID